MDPTTTAAYRARARERRETLAAGPPGTEPGGDAPDLATAFARVDAITAAAVALAGGHVPPPSTVDERRRWPSGRIEDRAAGE